MSSGDEIQRDQERPIERSKRDLTRPTEAYRVPDRLRETETHRDLYRLRKIQRDPEKHREREGERERESDLF